MIIFLYIILTFIILEVLTKFIFLIYKNKLTIKSFFSIFFGKITPFESWMAFTHFGKVFKNEAKND